MTLNCFIHLFARILGGHPFFWTDYRSCINWNELRVAKRRFYSPVRCFMRNLFIFYCMLCFTFCKTFFKHHCPCSEWKYNAFWFGTINWQCSCDCLAPTFFQWRLFPTTYLFASVQAKCNARDSWTYKSVLAHLANVSRACLWDATFSPPC